MKPSGSRATGRLPTELYNVFSQSGWRRTAIVNAILEGVLGAFLIAAVIYTASAAGDVESSYIIFQGRCETSGRINLAIHLLINLISSCIIASSNYFMQVLNSPTRQEVNQAHQKSYFLEIGVPSLRNLGHLSRHKNILWSLFWLSLIPIHLLFNSSVFETDYQGADFFMAIGTEDFAHGGEFFIPGASLMLPRVSTLSWDYLEDITADLNQSPPYATNISSDYGRNVSSTSQLAKQWDRLNAHDCRAQYGTCSSRSKWGSVVLVANSQLQKLAAGDVQEADVPGFPAPEHLYDWNEGAVATSTDGDSSNDLWSFWSDLMPLDKPNSLWLAAQCKMASTINGDCTHTCTTPLGLGIERHLYTDELEDTIEATTTSWNIPLQSYNASANNTRPTFNTTIISDETFLEVTHCYAEPLHMCKVAVSSEILLVVTVCVLLKVALSVVACTIVSGHPLVTLGDAIASFITQPDPLTKGKAGTRWDPAVEKAPWVLENDTQTENWRHENLAKINTAIPSTAWFYTYVLIVFGIIGTTVFFILAEARVPIHEDAGAFIHNKSTAMLRSEMMGLPFMGKVVLVNTPQLLLSFLYFAYNALFTRACTEMEWNSYALSYKPLRVSHPEEGQRETYRLQLPYRFSIPLILVSISLHWLFSNTIYIGIREGEYQSANSEGLFHLPGLADEAFVYVGFSTIAIFVALMVLVVIAFVPLFFKRRLKRNMVICGNSSFMISAACHASTWNAHGWQFESNSSLTTQPLIAKAVRTSKEKSEGDASTSSETIPCLLPGDFCQAEPDEDAKRSRILHGISTSKLCWGVVKMPPEWYEDIGHEVKHLAFGTADQDVQRPQPGTQYA